MPATLTHTMIPVQAIAVASAIEPGQAIGALSGDREFAVWRDASGALHAHPDRCPHRGMRLSFGFVRDDRLHCAYHGWSYDGGGVCRHVPALPAWTPPETIRAGCHDVREAQGLVWLALAAAAVPGPLDAWLSHLSLPPGRTATPLRSIRVTAPPDRLADTLVEQCAPGAVDEVLPGVYVVDGIDGEGGLLLALNPIGGGRSMLHAAALATGPAPQALRRALSARLQRLGAWLRDDTAAAGAIG